MLANKLLYATQASRDEFHEIHLLKINSCARVSK